MKIAIVGSRHYAHKDWVTKFVDLLNIHYAETGPIEIISGACPNSPDQWAVDSAKMHSIPYTEFPADWDRHGKSAGFVRNKTIVDASEVVVAFWDGTSRGTENTIWLARKADKFVAVQYDIGAGIEAFQAFGMYVISKALDGACEYLYDSQQEPPDGLPTWQQWWVKVALEYGSKT